MIRLGTEMDVTTDKMLYFWWPPKIRFSVFQDVSGVLRACFLRFRRAAVQKQMDARRVSSTGCFAFCLLRVRGPPIMCNSCSCTDANMSSGQQFTVFLMSAGRCVQISSSQFYAVWCVELILFRSCFKIRSSGHHSHFHLQVDRLLFYLHVALREIASKSLTVLEKRRVLRTPPRFCLSKASATSNLTLQIHLNIIKACCG